MCAISNPGIEMMSDHSDNCAALASMLASIFAVGRGHDMPTGADDK
jgi:hypothetical protein